VANGALLVVVLGLISVSQGAIGRLEKDTTVPLARSWERRGLYDHATAAYEHVLRFNPRDAESLLHLARLRSRTGGYTRALAAARAAHEAGDAPEARADALVLQARLLRGLGRWDGALRAAEQALAIDPALAEARHELARSARHAGDYARMREHLAAMADVLDPLAGSEPFREDIARARETVATLGAQPLDRLSPRDRYRLGMAHLALGRWQDAMETLGAAVDAPGAPGDAWFWLGVDALLAGDQAAARTRFESALAAAPTHLEARRARDALDRGAGGQE
jgi:tetratricopeptide (TPR) repeat protein